MNLVIDIGNTLTKVALFRGHDLVKLWRGEQADAAVIQELTGRETVSAAIVSSVKTAGEDLLPPTMQFLREADFPVLMAGNHLSIPITMHYKTPETLGTDRLAAAIAANQRFPNEHVLVINAGTCLTFDFVNEHSEYLGGSIAPGLQMRLKALHEYTGNLPLLMPTDNDVPLSGQSTKESVLSGVTNGMMAEIDGMIDNWQQKISFFNVVISGGDAFFFDKKLKNRIFAVDNIVLHGLNIILQYNV